VLARQGDPGDVLYLLLDGVLEVEVEGTVVTEVGPGALLGERAILESGKRTATLRSVTPCAVAVADRSAVDLASLEEVAKAHRREEEDATQ
jgi:CRP-like cAMP-binding protein